MSQRPHHINALTGSHLSRFDLRLQKFCQDALPDR
jgi:hypothetical protein